MIDTHTHLYLEEFDTDRGDMIQRAMNAGVCQFYMPNIDSNSIDKLLSTEKEFPGICLPMMGLHPCSVDKNFEAELDIVKTWLSIRHFCAVGEIGIDLYWDTTFEKVQEKALLQQIEWALDYELPIVIHSRNTIDLILDMLEPIKDTRLRGIFHCFGGSMEQAERIMKLGFYMGIGGVLTFKKSGLSETVKNIPLEYLVLETDSPYLAPAPYRGKRNESSYLSIIAQKLADCKGLSVQEIIVTTTINAKKNFGDGTQPNQTV